MAIKAKILMVTMLEAISSKNTTCPLLTIESHGIELGFKTKTRRPNNATDKIVILQS